MTPQTKTRVCRGRTIRPAPTQFCPSSLMRGARLYSEYHHAFDHDATVRPADGDLVGDGVVSFEEVRLSRHCGARCNDGATADSPGTARSTVIARPEGANRCRFRRTCCGNPARSGSAYGRGRAASAPSAIELGAGRDRSLARGALGIAQLDVVSPASAAILFRVAGSRPIHCRRSCALLAMKRIAAQRGCASLTASIAAGGARFNADACAAAVRYGNFVSSPYRLSGTLRAGAPTYFLR